MDFVAFLPLKPALRAFRGARGGASPAPSLQHHHRGLQEQGRVERPERAERAGDRAAQRGRVPAGVGAAKPRNPRHFGTIEGGRNSVSGGRSTRNTQSL